MKIKKRYISILLALCMLGGIVIISVTDTSADSGDRTIVSGVSDIASTKNGCIYFGTYLQSSDGSVLGYVDEAIKWRMLSEVDGKLLLISDQILDMKQYYASESEVTWESSTLRSWMNGMTEGNFYADAFSLQEKEVIAETELVNADNSEYEVDGGKDTKDKVFALSMEEAERYFSDNTSRLATNTAYAARRGDGVNMEGEADIYYLRSPGCLSSRAAVVTARGGINMEGRGLSLFTIGVRPAFNLDLTSVLFTSAASGGKATNGMESMLTAIGTDYRGDEWKATILDQSREAFKAYALSISDTTWTVRYDGAITGENEYLSAMIADENGDYTHYGRIKKLQEETQKSGTVEIDVSGLDMAGRTLYVFNEQYNGGTADDTRLTDYASQFIAIVPLTEITLSDFQNDNKTTVNQAFVKGAFDTDCYIANLKSEVCNSEGAPIDRLNATTFKVNIIYTSCGDYICYGGTNSDTGLQISVTETGGLSVAPLDIVFKPNIAGVTSFLNNEIALCITTEYGDYDGDSVADDTQFGFYFDGKLYNNEHYYIYNKQLSENSLVVNVSEKAVLIRSTSNSKEVLHNLADGNYTTVSTDFSGAYKIGKYIVSEIEQSGFCIPGDYEISNKENAQIGELILYNQKDTHPDGEVDVRDLIAMKKVQCGVPLATWSGTMAAYITDFNNTVIIDELLDVMQ